MAANDENRFYEMNSGIKVGSGNELVRIDGANYYRKTDLFGNECLVDINNRVVFTYIAGQLKRESDGRQFSFGKEALTGADVIIDPDREVVGTTRNSFTGIRETFTEGSSFNYHQGSGSSAGPSDIGVSVVGILIAPFLAILMILTAIFPGLVLIGFVHFVLMITFGSLVHVFLGLFGITSNVLSVVGGEVLIFFGLCIFHTVAGFFFMRGDTKSRYKVIYLVLSFLNLCTPFIALLVYFYVQSLPGA